MQFSCTTHFLCQKLNKKGDKMIILDVNKVSKNFGFGQLFENISLTLNSGDRIAVVGQNGSGKSTLLKMIAGLETIDSGTINIKKDARVAYLDQTGSGINDDRSVIEILHAVFSELNAIQDKLNNYLNQLNKNLPEKKYQQIMQKYCDLLDEFASCGGYEIESQIGGVIDGLKISKDILNKNFNNLSGGEKTIVNLAKILLMKPDLLLLDEPTNHLDIARIEWLENYLKSYTGAVVIVSHDRYFLDTMCNKILLIDGAMSKIYDTNYLGFLVRREEDFAKQMSQYKDEQNAIKRLEEQIKYFAERGMAKNSSTLCDRARALTTQLNRLKQNAIAKPKETKKINMSFDTQKKSSKSIIEINNLTVKTPQHAIILDNVSLNIMAHDSVALLGNNGCGKSTLIKCIMGDCILNETGDIRVGENVHIGYLPQIIEFVNSKIELLDYFRSEINKDIDTSRIILNKFGFNKMDMNKRVSTLSGGERVRLRLAVLLQQKINTLIFDEPTNHIDISTKEVLEKAISEFDGTLIFVSHDRYFLNKFAKTMLIFQNNKITKFYGNYDDYKKSLNVK